MDNDIRVELDSREEKLGYKLRETQIKKIPYTVILGQNEVDNNTISYRVFGTEETITLDKNKFVEFIKNKIKNKER